MPGPAPKEASQRANHRPPTFGEWRELGPLDRTYLPDLPAGYHERTLALWAGMQSDPVTQTFGACENAQCVVLANLHELAIKENTATCWAEVRQWMDRLGFTMKGKRDLRLRVVNSTAPVLRIV